MNPTVRSLCLLMSLIPYVYFGLRDLWHHKTHRDVSWTERILHLTLGMILTIIIPHAFLGHSAVVIAGMVLFVTARAFDEFFFHRGLDGAEIDIHAKTHFGFLVFVVGFAGVEWLQASYP